MTGMRDHQFIERLSESDVELIADALGEPADAVRARLRAEPAAIDSVLSHPDVFAAVFAPGDDAEVVRIGLTPMLVFGVLVTKVAADLDEASFVPEWVGAGERLPVFGVDPLRDFLDDPTRRYFLIEFLASFTKVASGSVWMKTRTGYRRKKFSELDPVSLAEMVDALPPFQRAGGYRRLGDVSLFLTGVFPDHTTRSSIGEMARARLARSAGVDERQALVDEDAVRFFEVVGPGWYRRATDAPLAVAPAYLHQVAERFTEARRLLNYLSDRYLHDHDTGLMHPVA